MKTPLLISFSLIVTISLKSQHILSDREKMKLTGQVKKIYENQFSIIEDSGLLKKGSLVSIVEASFSPEGFLTEEVINDNAWEPVLRTRYLYDDNNKLTKKEMVGTLVNGFRYITYKYDPAKKEIKETEYAGNDLRSKTTSTYDDDGKIVKQVITLHDGSKQSYQLYYKYDSNNNLVEVLSTLRNTQVNKEIYEYDDAGLLKLIHYFKNSNLVVSIEYKYVLDNLFNWTKQYEIASDPSWDQCLFRERNLTYY